MDKEGPVFDHVDCLNLARACRPRHHFFFVSGFSLNTFTNVGKKFQKYLEEIESDKKGAERGFSKVVNGDLSVTFNNSNEEETTPTSRTEVYAYATSVARVTEKITVTETTKIVMETKTTIKPGNHVFRFIAWLKRQQVFLKIFTGYSQISMNIAFNCNITFPALFEQFLVQLSILNLDVIPSFGLQCRFSNFDYISSMGALTSSLMIFFLKPYRSIHLTFFARVLD